MTTEDRAALERTKDKLWSLYIDTAKDVDNSRALEAHVREQVLRIEAVRQLALDGYREAVAALDRADEGD